MKALVVIRDISAYYINRNPLPLGLISRLIIRRNI